MAQTLQKKVQWFLTKLNKLLPQTPAILIFGIHPSESKTFKYLCRGVFSSVRGNYENLETTKRSFSR